MKKRPRAGTCPYCGFHKSGLSEEHVLTRAMGGALRPTNPFLIHVCTGCNNACGRWVDAPFVRSWFINNARARAAAKVLDLSANVAVPLNFMGRLEDWIDDQDVCELWLGPAGDQVYHFHRPYPDMPSFAGKPPHLRAGQFDQGAVYVVIRATNPVWHPILGKSLSSTFGDAAIHTLNAGPTPEQVPYPVIPPERTRHVDWLTGRANPNQVACNVSLDLDFSERFASKLALGFGASVLLPGFVTSDDAKRHRRALWERDADARGELGITTRDFLSNGDSLTNVAAWRDCHVLIAMPVGDRLVLAALFYSIYEVSVEVARTKDYWEGCIHPEGSVWVVSPALCRFAGPMPLHSFIAATRTGTGPLGPLSTYLDTAPESPPFHLPPLVGKQTT